MTEIEDQILDQLYFVTSYTDVRDQTGLSNDILLESLWVLIQKEWVKCFINPETEISVSESMFKSNYSDYHYLASKTGLMAHNLR